MYLQHLLLLLTCCTSLNVHLFLLNGRRYLLICRRVRGVLPRVRRGVVAARLVIVVVDVVVAPRTCWFTIFIHCCSCLQLPSLYAHCPCFSHRAPDDDIPTCYYDMKGAAPLPYRTYSCTFCFSTACCRTHTCMPDTSWCWPYTCSYSIEYGWEGYLCLYFIPVIRRRITCRVPVVVHHSFHMMVVIIARTATAAMPSSCRRRHLAAAWKAEGRLWAYCSGFCCPRRPPTYVAYRATTPTWEAWWWWYTCCSAAACSAYLPRTTTAALCNWCHAPAAHWWWWNLCTCRPSWPYFSGCRTAILILTPTTLCYRRDDDIDDVFLSCCWRVPAAHAIRVCSFCWRCWCRTCDGVVFRTCTCTWKGSGRGKLMTMMTYRFTVHAGTRTAAHCCTCISRSMSCLHAVHRTCRTALLKISFVHCVLLEGDDGWWWYPVLFLLCCSTLTASFASFLSYRNIINEYRFSVYYYYWWLFRLLILCCTLPDTWYKCLRDDDVIYAHAFSFLLLFWWWYTILIFYSACIHWLKNDAPPPPAAVLCCVLYLYTVPPRARRARAPRCAARGAAHAAYRAAFCIAWNGGGIPIGELNVGAHLSSLWKCHVGRRFTTILPCCGTTVAWRRCRRWRRACCYRAPPVLVFWLLVLHCCCFLQLCRRRTTRKLLFYRIYCCCCMCHAKCQCSFCWKKERTALFPKQHSWLVCHACIVHAPKEGRKYFIPCHFYHLLPAAATYNFVPSHHHAALFYLHHHRIFLFSIPCHCSATYMI